MVSLAAKIEYVIINSNLNQEIMAGRKKKLGYSEETPWFPEYYFGWIGIGNCNQETSIVYYYVCSFGLNNICLFMLSFFASQKLASNPIALAQIIC